MSEHRIKYRNTNRMAPWGKASPIDQYDGCPEMPYPAYERITPMDVTEFYDKWQTVYPVKIHRAADVPAMVDPDCIQWNKPETESDWPGLYDRELFHREIEWKVIRDLGEYLYSKLAHIPVTFADARRKGSYFHAFDPWGRTYRCTPPAKTVGRWCPGSNMPPKKKVSNKWIKRAYVYGYQGVCAECNRQCGVYKNGAVVYHAHNR